jgi:adenosylmethionine-8-amino-7-oxononanoate aminotransferase
MGVHLRPLGNILLLIPPLGVGMTDLEKLLNVAIKLMRKIEKLA